MGLGLHEERANGKCPNNSMGRLAKVLRPIFDDVEGRRSTDLRSSLASVPGMLNQQFANNSEGLPLASSAWWRSLAAIGPDAAARRLDPL